MALARIKVWGTEILTPLDLNTEFNNILGYLNSLSGGSSYGGTFKAVNTGLQAQDPDGSNYLTFLPGSNLTSDRKLTFLTGDADVSLTVSSGIVATTVRKTNWNPFDGSSQGIVYTGVDCYYVKSGAAFGISGKVTIGANANGNVAIMGGLPGSSDTNIENWTCLVGVSSGTVYIGKVHGIVAAGTYMDFWSLAGVQLTNANLSGLTLYFNICAGT
jgi:hypothetical protein